MNGKQIGMGVDFPEDIWLIIETPRIFSQLLGLNDLEILASLEREVKLKQIADTIRRMGLDPMTSKPVGK